MVEFELRKVALQTNVFQTCYGFIALRFLFFFLLIAQFFTMNLILFHFNHNTVKCLPLAIILFFRVKSQTSKICIVFCNFISEG